MSAAPIAREVKKATTHFHRRSYCSSYFFLLFGAALLPFALWHLAVQQGGPTFLHRPCSFTGLEQMASKRALFFGEDENMAAPVAARSQACGVVS